MAVCVWLSVNCTLSSLSAISWPAVCDCDIMVKSGKFGRPAKFGQRTCLFHIIIIGIKINSQSKQWKS